MPINLNASTPRIFATDGTNTMGTTYRAAHRLTLRRIAIILLTTFVIIPLTACMIIGFGRAIAAHDASTTVNAPISPANSCEGDVKAFNDGWNTALYGDGTAAQ